MPEIIGESTAPSIVRQIVPNGELSRPIYNVADIGKPGVPKPSSAQLQEIDEILKRVKPQYRRYLKFTFFGPQKGLAVFLSRAPTPPDYGAESYVLNGCKATPHCTYLCRLEIKYPSRAVVPIGPSGFGCVQGELWFFKND
jgi:hypothetical protein